MNENNNKFKGQERPKVKPLPTFKDYPIEFIKNLIQNCDVRITQLKNEMNIIVNLKLNYKKILKIIEENQNG